MNKLDVRQVSRAKGVQGRTRVLSLSRAPIVALCLIAIGCAARPEPLQKAFDAAGGQEALVEPRRNSGIPIPQTLELARLNG